jgi:hypothetical protein
MNVGCFVDLGQVLFILIMFKTHKSIGRSNKGLI